MEGYGNENPGAFQPTRPLRGATKACSAAQASPRCFNPRAPCGARLALLSAATSGRKFQPTRPLRGATSGAFPAPRLGRISTHAPLAGRDKTVQRLLNWTQNFNPRAPCGARLHCPDKISTQFLFQPTRPLRGATRRRRCAGGAMQISTHAPLAGRDTVSSIPSRTLSHFNPRAPCGARQSKS